MQLHCVVCRLQNIKGRQLWTDPLRPRSVRYFCFDYGALNCVRKRKWTSAHSLRVCSPESLRDPICADERKMARTPGGVLYANWTGAVIRRSAEPQLERTSTFFLAGISFTS
jgi:hypothetical protein